MQKLKFRQTLELKNVYTYATKTNDKTKLQFYARKMLSTNHQQSATINQQ